MKKLLFYRFLLASLFTIISLFAIDQIELENGTILLVEIIGQDAETITYQKEGGTFTIDKAQVKGLKLNVEVDKYLQRAISETNAEKKEIFLQKSISIHSNSQSKKILTDYYVETLQHDKALTLFENDLEQKLIIKADKAFDFLKLGEIETAYKNILAELEDNALKKNSRGYFNFLLIKLFCEIEQNDHKQSADTFKTLKKLDASSIDKEFSRYCKTHTFKEFSEAWQALIDVISKEEPANVLLSRYYLNKSDLMPVAYFSSINSNVLTMSLASPTISPLSAEYHLRVAELFNAPSEGYLLTPSGRFFTIDLNMKFTEEGNLLTTISPAMEKWVVPGSVLYFQKKRFLQNETRFKALRGQSSKENSYQEGLTLFKKELAKGDYWRAITTLLSSYKSSSNSEEERAHLLFEISKVFYNTDDENSPAAHSLADRVNAEKVLNELLLKFPNTLYGKLSALELMLYSLDSKQNKQTIENYEKLSKEIGEDLFENLSWRITPLANDSLLLINENRYVYHALRYLIERDFAKKNLTVKDVSPNALSPLIPFKAVATANSLSQIKILSESKAPHIYYHNLTPLTVSKNSTLTKECEELHKSIATVYKKNSDLVSKLIPYYSPSKKKV